MIRCTAASPRRPHAWLSFVLPFLALVVAGCGGSGGPQHSATVPSTTGTQGAAAPVPGQVSTGVGTMPQPDGAPPPVRTVRAPIPTGPVGDLLRHVLPGADEITAIDLKAVRLQLSIRGNSIPYQPTVTQSARDSELLAAFTAVAVPPTAGATLLEAIDFGEVRAIVTFAGAGHRGLLLKVNADRLAIIAGLQTAGWIHTRTGYYSAIGGALTRARLRLFAGGVVLALPGADAARSAAQRRIPTDDRTVAALLGTYPAPGGFVERGGPRSCVAEIVGKEQLSPHAASVTVIVRGRPLLRRLVLNRALLLRRGLIVGRPEISGHTINVPVVPSARAALGALVGVLGAVPIYRCP